MIIDGLAEILFAPNPRSFPAVLPSRRVELGLVSIGTAEALIIGASAACAAALFLFLGRSRLGRAIRAAAQDPEAAMQVGIRITRTSAAAFALASALGGLAGVLVGLYYNIIMPSTGFQAGLKGFTAAVLGGLGSVPGAMAGGLALGICESFGVAAFGSQARGLVAFALLLAALILRPNGLFGGREGPAREALTGTFLPQKAPVRVPWFLAALLGLAALALPFMTSDPYLLQILAGAWISAILALSLSLVAGMAGIVSLGQAGLMAIGAYASGLLSLRLGWPFPASLAASGAIAAIVGGLLASPALRLKGHYVSIATLAMGELVNQAILNGGSFTGGAMGLAGIPAPRIFGREIGSVQGFYYLGLAALALCALAVGAIGRSPLGRALRAIREDESAAEALGMGLRSYKALAFSIGAFLAGVAGSLTAHLYTYVNHETFGSSLSIQGLTMAILGGLGNVWGAIAGALILSGLPEALRFASSWRSVLFGAILILALRFRPQGLLGSR
jgi:ABC-type branched-chain amino acid transport system, permease component